MESEFNGILCNQWVHASASFDIRQTAESDFHIRKDVQEYYQIQPVIEVRAHRR